MNKIKSIDSITSKQSQIMYCVPFEDKYIVYDNMDMLPSPKVIESDYYKNTTFFYYITVLEGTLHLLINRIPVDVHANQTITICPWTQVKARESECVFFAILTSSYIMNDIFEHSNIGKEEPIRAFTFTHRQLTPEQAGILRHCYMRLKMEQQRDMHLLKEMVLRAYIRAFMAKLYTFVDTESVIDYTRYSKQNNLFSTFITLISKEHQHERSVKYYAKLMGVSSKYLSSITHKLTGMPASMVIDLYVTDAIKQQLYTHELNIKTISEMFNFPSQSFFGRFFKRMTGVSPNEYIKQHNKDALIFKQK